MKAILSVTILLAISLLVSTDLYFNREGSWIGYQAFWYLEIRGLRDFLVDYSLQGESVFGGEPTDFGWPEHIEECPIPSEGDEGI